MALIYRVGLGGGAVRETIGGPSISTLMDLQRADVVWQLIENENFGLPMFVSIGHTWTPSIDDNEGQALFAGIGARLEL